VSDRGHPVFAWFYSKLAGSMDRRGMSDLRDEVLQRAEGMVVEIGAGTGLNFAHYRRRRRRHRARPAHAETRRPHAKGVARRS
jgi:tRNA U34 5-methylaminomethyl-2-thiouridine-forming methyltransferase MnmC